MTQAISVYISKAIFGLIQILGYFVNTPELGTTEVHHYME